MYHVNDLKALWVRHLVCTILEDPTYLSFTPPPHPLLNPDLSTVLGAKFALDVQEDIVREVETGAAAKAFDLSLPDLGPYNLDFTRSGKHVVVAGRKGHMAVLDWKQARLVTEIQAPPPPPPNGKQRTLHQHPYSI